MIQATLRLFKAIPIDPQAARDSQHDLAGRKEICPTKVDAESLQKTISHGYVLDPRITLSEQLLNSVNEVIGITGTQANATFHKSWEKVRSADIEQLVIEQLIHYLTTYGFASMGIYDASTVYIPHEKLELPALANDLSLTYVRGMTPEELLQAVVQLGSGIALDERSLDDAMQVVKGLGCEPDFLSRIRNHEFLARLYEHYDLVPEEPVAFLRYLVFQLTGNSLLIKNDVLIEQIKSADPERKCKLEKWLDRAPDNLASIFYRFKPLFLALKSISREKNVFNRLRKQAVKQHRPLPIDFLNSVTEQIKRGSLDLEELASRIQTATVFRRIRLAYALQFRLNAGESMLYSVRNGSGWATDFQWPDDLVELTTAARNVVVNSLIEVLRGNVAGKKCFIPQHVNYALPASEKQFAGPFPTGSYVVATGATVFGVHWYNTEKRSIDLDLSLLSASGKVGWDAQYRSDEALFSGDMTDAPRPHGATEMFYVKEGIAANLVICNYYNFSASDPVDAKIIVAHDAPKELTLNYMVDVNHIVAQADVKISRKQTVVGLVLTVEDQTRFYFGNVSVGCGITSADRRYAGQAREFLAEKFINGLNLRTLLEAAGAEVVSAKSDDPDLIDLSPENLTKSSLLDLFHPVQTANSDSFV